MPTPAEAAAILRARFGFPSAAPTPDTPPTLEDYSMIGDPATEPAAAPPPEDAASILRAHFGMVRDPIDPNVLVGDPTGSIALGGNRAAKEAELAAKVDRLGWPMSGMPVESFVPGEPGRRQVTQPFLANAMSDKAQLDRVRGEIAADPFTGTAEQARVGGIQKRLDQAAMIQRPEIADEAKTLANRNYFAEFMKNQGIKEGEKMGEYKAAGSPEAYKAAMTPIRAAGSSESQAVLDAAGRRVVEANEARRPGIKYTAQEQQVIDKANEIQEQGPKLLALMENDLPGIGQDPTKYGSWFDKANASIGGFIYRRGKTQTANSDRIRQLTGYLEVAVPRILNSGRLNQQQYEDLKQHAPQIGFSDGANYERIKAILHDILPGVLRGIDEGHGANPTRTDPQEDKFAPPTDEQLGMPSPYSLNR